MNNRPVRREILIVWDLALALPRPKAPKGFYIVRSRKPDLPALCALAVRAYEGPWDWWLEETGKEKAFEHFMKQMSRLASLKNCAVFSAFRDKILAGSAVASMEPDEEGDCLPSYGLVVHPDFRGKGLGKALLLYSLSWLKRQGTGRAQVTTTAYANSFPPAVYNYLHFGGRILREERM